MSRVSVIIPCYNGQDYLAQALDSVLASSYDDYEIVIVNDGSTDDSEALVNSYLPNPKITYISQENKGLAGARNTGILNTTGRYLVFLDADDLVEPEKLEKQVAWLQANVDCAAVFSQSEFFFDDTTETKPSQLPVYQGNIYLNLLDGNFIHVNSVMVDRQRLKEDVIFDQAFREFEDWDLWLRISLAGARFGYIQDILSRVRLHGANMSSNRQQMYRRGVEVLNKQIQTLEERKHSSLAYKKKAYGSYFRYRILAGQHQGLTRDVIRSVGVLGGVNTVKIIVLNLANRLKLPVRTLKVANDNDYWKKTG